MTTPAPGRGTRAQLADALAVHRLTTPRQCLCGWRDTDDWPDTEDAHARHVAAALLPVVDRIADERAAEALEQAADDLGNPAVRRELHARAAALRARTEAGR